MNSKDSSVGIMEGSTDKLRVHMVVVNKIKLHVPTCENFNLSIILQLGPGQF